MALGFSLPLAQADERDSTLCDLVWRLFRTITQFAEIIFRSVNSMLTPVVRASLKLEYTYVR